MSITGYKFGCSLKESGLMTSIEREKIWSEETIEVHFKAWFLLRRVQTKLLCRIGTRHLISWKAHASAEVIDSAFEHHFTEFQMPAARTHGGAERALEA